MTCQRWLWSSVVSVGMVAALSAQAPKPTFEVASVKYRGDQRLLVPPVTRPPNVFYRTGDTVAELIQFAYSIPDVRLFGGPDWMRTERFEIDASRW